MNSSALLFAPASLSLDCPAIEPVRPESGNAPANAESSRSPFASTARMLNAGCYSVSIFGSGADYAGL